MTNRFLKSLTTTILGLMALLPTTMAQFIFPKTDVIPVTDTLHGYTLTDNYRWLEDKTDKKVIKWTKAQHDATLTYLEESCPPVEGLEEEISAYLDRDIISPLQLVADRQFFTKKRKGEAQSKLFTILDGNEKLIFDPEKIDPSGKSSMTGRSFTEKGEKVAVGLQSKGAEISTYYIIENKTGVPVGDPVEGLRRVS